VRASRSAAIIIPLKAAANEAAITELACFLGDSSRELVRIWPDEPPARRTAWLVVHQEMRRSARRDDFD
jgi:DNA-binding transcriptional LysR family regulator